MDEFDLYCRNKPAAARDSLSPVRQLILDTVPEVGEGRVHFYLVYHFGAGVVAMLHLDAKGQVNITFATGEDLQDPARLLKGSSIVRTVKVTSEAYFAKHREAIADLLRQSFALIRSRVDATSTMRMLSPDQPSP